MEKLLEYCMNELQRTDQKESGTKNLREKKAVNNMSSGKVVIIRLTVE